MNLLKLSDLCQFKHRNVVVVTMLMFGGNHATLQAQETAASPESEAALQAAAVEPQTLELHFESILEQAMADNPGTDVANARIDQASELSRQNGSYRYPKIDVAGTLGPEHNDPAPSSEEGRATTNGRNLKLTVSKLLFDGGTSRLEFQRSKTLESAAHAEASIVIEELFLDVARYYIDYWRYQYELAQAEDFVATMEELVSDLGAMYGAGAASKLEVDFARARLASAQGVKSSATASLNNAFSELEYLAPGLRPFIAVSPDRINEIRLRPLAEYIENGAATNSGFVTNRFSREATQLRVESQKGRYLPSLDFEITGSLIDDEGGPSERRDKIAAKLLINYTLYSGGERKGAVRRAKAQIRELEAELVQLERDVFRAIDQAYNNITSSRLTLDAVEAEIAANQELQRLNRKNLELGTINIIELIDVEERLFSASSRKGEVVASMYKEYLSLTISAGFIPDVLKRFMPDV